MLCVVLICLNISIAICNSAYIYCPSLYFVKLSIDCVFAFCALQYKAILFCQTSTLTDMTCLILKILKRKLLAKDFLKYSILLRYNQFIDSYLAAKLNVIRNTYFIKNISQFGYIGPSHLTIAALLLKNRDIGFVFLIPGPLKNS